MASRPELKVDDEFGFIKFFRNLPPKADDLTIQVFDRGDFYSAHGEDAVFVARNVQPIPFAPEEIADMIRCTKARLSSNNSVDLQVWTPLQCPLPYSETFCEKLFFGLV